MSIYNKIAVANGDKLVIPCMGKMFKSNISKKNKALCYVLNKGYIETSELETMLYILDSMGADSAIIIKVGNIEKIVLSDTQNVVYRQRLFFKDITKLLGYCKLYCLSIEIPQTFNITINTIMNCQKELPYLERYAAKQGITINQYLVDCFLIIFDDMLRSLHLNYNLNTDIDLILEDKIGFLDRAPFLISSYNIENHSSGVYINMDDKKSLFKDMRKYSQEYSLENMNFGYTDFNIQYDIRRGKLHHAS